MNSHRNYILRAFLYIAIWFLLTGWLTKQAHGQVDLPCNMPATIIAKGQNSVPTGKLEVKTYRLETVDQKLFCLNVSLDSYISGTYLIWINQEPRAAYYLRRGELTASIPLQWLEDDAAISVSKIDIPDDVTTLPERLRLPESVMRLRKAAPAERLRLTNIRRVTRTTAGAPKTFIEIVITNSAEFNPVVASNMWVIQIGKKEFPATVNHKDANKLTCLMTPEEFAQLKDGDLVRVNWGFGTLRSGHAGRSFARLNKRDVGGRVKKAASAPDTSWLSSGRSHQASR